MIKHIAYVLAAILLASSAAGEQSARFDDEVHGSTANTLNRETAPNEKATSNPVSLCCSWQQGQRTLILPAIMIAARLSLKFKPVKGPLLVAEGSFQRHGLFKKIGKRKMRKACILSFH